MLNIVHMTVNGKEVELAVDPRESLLETLRNRLGLTSVKTVSYTHLRKGVPFFKIETAENYRYEFKEV